MRWGVNPFHLLGQKGPEARTALEHGVPAARLIVAAPVDSAEIIRHRKLRRGGEVRLEVIDTGPGLPPEDLDKIFDVHYSTKTGGSGLGLPTTRRIVREHGGNIRVESEPGKGTRFIIHLPV